MAPPMQQAEESTAGVALSQQQA
ncbi:hypothetical protein HaLaN_09501, partial [Haematococcus lacustris]